MADYRKWFWAFAVVAILLSLGSTTASAQQNNQAAFVCNANAGVPPLVRAEGITELVGDLILNCTGGSPTPAGVPIPLSNFQIFLNTNITSRIYSGNLSEAILAIDEPFPGTQGPVPASVAPAPGVALVQNGCQAINSTNCAILGTGGGAGATGPYNGSAGHFNVFQGLQNGANSVTWLGVPVDAPGTANTRVIRMTNIRANACQLGTSSTLIPTQIVMFISVNGSQQVTINNPQQTVAFIVPGLIVGNATTQFVQCVNINGNLLGSSIDPGQTGTVNITAREGFASSFKVRNYAQLFLPNGTSLAPNGRAPSNVDFQNIFGFPYNTESGYVSATPGITPNGTGNGAIGEADQGTQIRFTINNIGQGVSIFVPNQLALTNGSGGPQTGLAVLVGSGGGAGNTALTSVGNSATAVYEVWYSNVNVIETITLPVRVAAVSNTGQNLPGIGQSTAQVSFAPVSNVQTADRNAPIPRFCDNSTPRNLFAINQCTCNLLFPFVTNQSGFNTGIAIANTTLDPFGTSTQAGKVTLFFYGGVAPTNPAPAPITTTGAGTLGGIVPAGCELVFTLLNGGGVMPGNCQALVNSNSTTTLDLPAHAMAGFQGYIIATANFQYCHAFAFISDTAATNLAEGYLAVQLDIPALNRTGQVGENEGH